MMVCSLELNVFSNFRFVSLPLSYMRKLTVYNYWVTATFVMLCLIITSGCATYQQTADQQLTAFQSGNSEQAIAFFENNRSANNRQLHTVEAGRLKMLEGDFESSHRDFESVIDEIFEVEEGAMIRMRDVGGAALASTFLDDRSRPYNLPSFEAVFVFQYQSLNSIFLGEMEAAYVEMRRAVDAKDMLADLYEEQIEKARQEALQDADEDSEDISSGMKVVDDYYARMGPVLGRAKNGFQNPFVWYFAGLMYELQGELGNAYIAYKKAWELEPENKTLQIDLLRLGKHQNPDEWTAFKQRFQKEINPLDDNQGVVIVIYEEGWISKRYSEAIRMLLGTRNHAITFPVYRDGPYRPVSARVLWGDHDAGRLKPLCYLQSLAYHDLRERIRGIATRNISRAITREITREVGRRSDSAALRLGTLIATAVASASEQADTRGWYSLPMGVQILRENLDSGEKTLMVRGSGTGRNLEIPMHLMPGEVKLLWIADAGVRVSYCVASLTHHEQFPPIFERIMDVGLSLSTPPPLSEEVIDSVSPSTDDDTDAVDPTLPSPQSENRRQPAHGSSLGGRTRSLPKPTGQGHGDAVRN